MQGIEVESRIKALGLTQPEFGDLVGLQKNSVNRWCRGLVQISARGIKRLTVLEDFVYQMQTRVERSAAHLPPNAIIELVICATGEQFAKAFPRSVEIFTHNRPGKEDRYGTSRLDPDHDGTRLDLAARLHAVAMARAAVALRAAGREVTLTHPPEEDESTPQRVTIVPTELYSEN